MKSNNRLLVLVLASLMLAGFFKQATAQTVSFTKPTEGQYLATLTNIAGMVQAGGAPITQVVFSIRDTYTGRYWNGSTFQTSPYDLAATINGTSWVPAATVAFPYPAFGHDHELAATVTDEWGYTGTSAITVHTAAADFSPLYDGQTVTNLSGLGGAIASNINVTSLTFRIHELDINGGNGRWWNGTSFQSTQCSLASSRNGYSWSAAVPMPELNSGQNYELTVTVNGSYNNTITVTKQMAPLTWDKSDTQGGTNLLSAPNTNGGNYYFEVNTTTPDDGVWRTALNVPSGNAYLYMSQGSMPTTSSYSYASTRSFNSNGFVLNYPNEFNGGQTWYILVHVPASNPCTNWTLLTGDIFVHDLGALATNNASSTNASIKAEGMVFFKTVIPTTTAAWQVWLNGSNHNVFVSTNTAPTTNYYGLKQYKQMLVVPPYLDRGTFNGAYFVGVPGTPGTPINLTSRQQPLIPLAFNSQTSVTVGAGTFPYVTYQVEVPEDQIAWQLNLTPSSGNPAVAVRRSLVPNEFKNDAFSEVPATVGASVTLVPSADGSGAGLSDGTFYVTVYSTDPYVCSLTNGNPVITPVSYVFCVTNDAPTRAGWRYYTVTNTAEQLDTLGWQLQLSNHFAGTEIALRRNAVPGRWELRDNGLNYQDYSSRTAGYVHFSSTNGILQEPGHQADVWYIGVYTPVHALGSFVLTGKQIIPQDVSFDNASASVSGQLAGVWGYFSVDVPANALGWDLRLTNVTAGSPKLVIRQGLLPTHLETDGVDPRGTTWPNGKQLAAVTSWSGHWSGCSDQTPVLTMAMGRPLQGPARYYIGVMDPDGTSSYKLFSRGIGETNYTIRVQPLAFDRATNIMAQPMREWTYFRIEVPTNSNLLGWDLRLTNAAIGSREMVVCRDFLPTSIDSRWATWAGDWYYCYYTCTYPWNQTNWPSGYEWRGDKDWSQCSGRAPMLAMAKGYPLQPGTYYIGVVAPCSAGNACTLLNRGIGAGYTIPVRDLAFTGSTNISGLPVSEGDYFRVVVPANQVNWKMHLTNNLGEVSMKVQRGHLPSLYQDGTLQVGRGGKTMMKPGCEQWALMPENEAASVSNGTYYVLVASQGRNADASGCEGTNTVNYSLDSGTNLVLLPNNLSYTTSLNCTTNQQGGELNFFQFNIPPGLGCVEVRLTPTAGNPAMYLQTNAVRVSPGGGDYAYGYYGGVNYQWTDKNLITLINPQAGTYSLSVYAGTDDYNSYVPASYTLQVRAVAPISVGFDNGTYTTNQPANEWHFFEINVPADALAWDLRLTNTTGNPRLVVRRSLLPTDLNESFTGNLGRRGYTTWPDGYQTVGDTVCSDGTVSSMLMLAMGMPLQQATYYVGVISSEACSYTLLSRGVGENKYAIRVKPVDFDGFATNITAQPICEWKFFKINVPADSNLLGWDLRLTNTVGSPSLVVSRAIVPTSTQTTPAGDWAWYSSPWNHTAWPSGYQWMAGADWSGCDGESRPMLAMATGYPLQQNQTYYIGIFSSCVESSYSFVSRGIGTNYTIPIRTLAFNGTTGNDLAVNEGDYYRVEVPANQPNWKLHLNLSPGDAMLKVHRGCLPSLGGGGYGDLQLPEQGGQGMKKQLDEQWTLLPENGAASVSNGVYYVLVASQGQGADSSGCNGGGIASYLLTSETEVMVLPDTLPTYDITQWDSAACGETKVYQFNVPPGLTSMEVSLPYVNWGSPMMMLTDASHLIGPGNSGIYGVNYPYGNFGGGVAKWADANLITIANPQPGTYNLTVYAADDWSGMNDASYMIQVHAGSVDTVLFDGGAAPVYYQAPGTWQYFKIEVPSDPNLLGWDIRLTNATGNPQMVICRSNLPVNSSSTPEWHSSTYNVYPWNHTNWPNGYQWAAEPNDWRGCYLEYEPMLAMAMGNPLEPGTYYIGVQSDYVCSYVLQSRGIGTNYTIPVRTLAFNGSAANNDLPLHEGDYYRVVVPPNQPDWKMHVGASAGDLRLRVHKDYLPGRGLGGSWPVPSAREIAKPGDELWTALPEYGESTVPAGTYYLLVISEGVGADSGCDGIGNTDYTLQSWAEPALVMGTVSLGNDLTKRTNQLGGEPRFFQFTVPSGCSHLEVRLEDRVGNPWLYLSTGSSLVSPGSYGCFGGVGAQWQNGSLITIPNVAAGTYSLTVYARDYANAEYNLRVSTPEIPVLNFCSEYNTNGHSNVVTGILANEQHRYYKVSVPSSVNGAPVLGWQLNLTSSNGVPNLRVRPAQLPEDTCDTTSWTTGATILAPPYLREGDWYVDVVGGDMTGFSLSSSAITTNTLAHPLWVMPQVGQSTTAPGLSLPRFGDSGIDINGNQIGADGGSDLKLGQFAFYAIIVPTNNAGLLRTELVAISGDPNLYLRVGAAPTSKHCNNGTCSRDCGGDKLLVDRQLDDVTTEYGNWVPMDGKYETNLAPGLWVLAVQADGDSNARYRLKLDCGNPVTNALVQNLALHGGYYTNQSIAGGDWRYYRVEVPDPAPADWVVSFASTRGEARMFVRDVVPPGVGESVSDFRDWKSDWKNKGLGASQGMSGTYPSSLADGTHIFTTPPLRPGSVYYLGFTCDLDSTFWVSSSTNGGPMLVNGSIDYRGGGMSADIAGHGVARYRIDVPQSATYLLFQATNSGSVNFTLEQGTLALLGGPADWENYGSATATCSYSLTNSYWPWLPGFTYYLTATNTSSQTQHVGVVFAPWITVQPQSRTVNVGASVTFNVVAQSSFPLTYQWKFNDYDIPGATESSYTKSNVQLSDAGSYSVDVCNLAGCLRSTNAILTVIEGPSLGLLNIDFGSGPGPSGKVGPAAVGLSDSDFWNFYTRDDDQGNWLEYGRIDNLLTSDGTASGVALAVSNAPGCWGNGSYDPMYYDYIYPFDGIATLTLTNLPPGQYSLYIYSYDGNYQVTAGGTDYGTQTNFDPAAGSYPLIWQQGVQYSRFDGVTIDSPTQELVVTVQAGVEGYAIVSGMQIAQTGVLLPPSITTAPVSQSVIQGHRATFSVVASGSLPLTYEWQHNGATIAGATGSSYVVPNAASADAGTYSVTIANPQGSVSASATLTVTPAVCISAPAGLVSKWQAEDSSADSMGRNPAYLGGEVSCLPGFIGKAFKFNADEHIIMGSMRVPASTSLNVGSGGAFTIEGWVLDECCFNLGWYDPATGSVGLQTYGGGALQGHVQVSPSKTIECMSTPDVIYSDGYHHVAMTYQFDIAQNQAVVRLYVDGVEVGNTVASHAGISEPWIPATTGDFTIGPGLNAWIDELSIYNRALSGSEVAAIYDASVAGTCPIAPSAVNVQISSPTVIQGHRVDISATVSGQVTYPLTYVWRHNGVIMPGVTTSSFSLQSALSDAGSYSVNVSNGAGSAQSANAPLTVTPATCIAAPSGLVSWWQGEGNTQDAMGGNPGVLDSATYGSGFVGQAFTSTSGGSVRVPASPSLNVGAGGAFTFEGWIKRVPGDWNVILSWPGTEGYNGVTLWLYDGEWGQPGGIYGQIHLSSGDSFYPSIANPSLVAPGFYEHVALTYADAAGQAVLRVYVNGVKVGEEVYNHSPGVTVTANTIGDLSFGSASLGSRTDEVALYNRALSGSEILAIYNASVAGKCALPAMAPTIIVQPVSQSVGAGSSATFCVSATGTPVLTYQWRLNGVNIAGATTACYTIANVQRSHAGTYTVVVANAYGNATSDGATLTVNSAPSLSLTSGRVTEQVVNFESIYDYGNDLVMFRWPFNSGSTSAFIDMGQACDAQVVTSFPAGNVNGDGAKVLRADWTFKAATNNPWLRLTTANPMRIPNPAFYLTGRIRFDIYTSRSIKLGLGLRETGCNVAVGANGGTTGSIEWVGVTSKTLGAPNCTRTINASNWTTVEFDLASEPKCGFTGDGYLNGAQGVLEHLAIVPNEGLTNYTIYVDNFQMITNVILPSQAVRMNSNSKLTFTAVASDVDAGQILTYSLDTGAPGGAYINPSNGAFTWTPTAGQANQTYNITVRASDNGVPVMSTPRTVTVTVVPDPLNVMSSDASAVEEGAGKLLLNWPAVAGAAYQVQYKQGAEGQWTNLGEPVIATGAEASLEISETDQDTQYRIIDLGSPVLDQ